MASGTKGRIFEKTAAFTIMIYGMKLKRPFSFAYLVMAALLFAFMAVSCPSGDADNPKINFSAEDNGLISDGDNEFANESKDAGMRAGQSFVVRFSLAPESATVDMLRFEYDKETVGIEILPDKKSIRITLLKKPAGEKTVSVIAYPADPSSKTAVGKLNLLLYEKPVEKISIRKSDGDELDAGVIEAPRRGELVFAVPYLNEYLLNSSNDN